MALLSAQCGVCKGDQFRATPPEGWVERVVLPAFSCARGVVLSATNDGICPHFNDGRRLRTPGDKAHKDAFGLLVASGQCSALMVRHSE